MLPCQNKIENVNTKMENLSLENYLNHSKIFKNCQKTKCGKQNDFSKSMNFKANDYESR